MQNTESDESLTKIRVAFLIRSLQAAGAERQLAELVMNMDRRRFDPLVVCFYPGGEFEAEVARAGVPVISLEKSGRWDWLGFYRRLARRLRELNPDILHGYVEVPNLLAVLARPFLPGTRIVLGLRGSGVDLGRLPWFIRVAYALQPLFSRRADLCISNSHAGKEFWTSRGVPADRIRVIPNGIDTIRFHPKDESNRALLSRLGVPEADKVIASVGRIYPGKGLEVFIQAAAILLKRNPSLAFLWAGEGPQNYLTELKKIAADLGAADHIIWTGVVKDMNVLYPAADIFCSSSVFGEGFPNVLAEAMACGLPCVSTDVGDVKEILGDAGFIVPPRDPQALADALQRLIDLSPEERRRMGQLARARIVENYSVEKMVERTQQVLAGLLR